MKVEIINVGTELLLGEIVNTNAAEIQKACRELGFSIFYQTVVGDNPDRFKECLETAFLRGADMVITTGGLGPTADDLTKELSAEYLGLDMEFREEEAKKVFAKCSFLMGSNQIPETNYKQAYYPKGAYILENDVGTANGCVMSRDQKRIVNLPGPPKEMRYVLSHSLLPYLERYREDKIYTYNINTMMIGESDMAQKLNDIVEEQEEVSIALYASEDHCRVRLAVKAKSQIEADHRVASAKHIIEERLKDYIIEAGSLNEALFAIMPPYYIEYKDGFRLSETFCLGKCYSVSKEAMKLEIGKRKHPLGDIITVIIHYGDETEAFEVAALKEATLSYARIESRIVANIYRFLKKNTRSKD